MGANSGGEAVNAFIVPQPRAIAAGHGRIMVVQQLQFAGRQIPNSSSLDGESRL